MTLILNIPSVDVCSLWSTTHNIARAPVVLKVDYWLSGVEISCLLNWIELPEDKDQIFPLCKIWTFFFLTDFFLINLFLNPPNPILPLSPLQHIHKSNGNVYAVVSQILDFAPGSLHGQRNLKYISEKLRKDIYHFVILLYYSRKHTLANSLMQCHEVQWLFLL